MAQLTPAEILAISEPIEAIYQRTVDELLINIAHHFNISGWERTRYWEIKKLSEMGALTKESARIIAQNTKMLPEEIEKAFLQVAEKACLDIDPQLRAAAEKGILQDPGTSPSTSVLMRDSIRSYVAQAQDTLNMVNTTMLQSTREAYLRGIATAVSEAQLQEAKEILETQALEVVTGQETRVRAIRKAMNQLTATGITGFYDKSGRKWHAESYAAMVVRSTSHNAAIQAIKTRQQEFGGGDIFQVSSHNGARPLCFPYQGKFYSWSAGPGEFEDGSGHTRRYENIDQTSYGEPAGLFGINCGHHPIPMIPGFSYPQEGPTQTKAENDKEYKESQTQRAYERQVREAKRDLEIAKAIGDEEAIKDAKQKVAQEQAKIRAYVAETGRARRYDREQIAGGKDVEGYKGYRRQRNSDIPLSSAKAKPKKPKEVDPEAQKLIDSLKKSGVEYKQVSEYKKQPTEGQIIKRIAGGDMTAGSCSSLAFCYIGNKNGLDVLDFRGGNSQNFFSRNANIKSIAKLKGIDAQIIQVDKEAGDTWKILKDLPKDKQYYLAVGKHAAMVKNTERGVEYLELQSRYDERNGWNPFEGNKLYSTPVLVLQKRFGCRKTADKLKLFASGNSLIMKRDVILMDADSFKDNDGFREILGYINTDESKQKKGAAGSVK